MWTVIAIEYMDAQTIRVSRRWWCDACVWARGSGLSCRSFLFNELVVKFELWEIGITVLCKNKHTGEKRAFLSRIPTSVAMQTSSHLHHQLQQLGRSPQSGRGRSLCCFVWCSSRQAIHLHFSVTHKFIVDERRSLQQSHLFSAFRVVRRRIRFSSHIWSVDRKNTSTVEPMENGSTVRAQ